ncbi:MULTISPECIES: (2Fe-2S)-binding protein [unclassified Streptomyces]|uniref:(2Fe-2S)-binding protein n=1 Tax=unclassified Streptomyces TaxID=2593676 RepID=UPI0016609FD7|nr:MULTISPECIES: (2Fe-2S)-binding protein [unclassified Streptomyces]MBD0709507.1 iron-sulfur protein [Streptomyces sp. CBMA291]MBD0713217.1 iron-sulfur protein [Streptomyces sp. CBMA370]
MTVPALLSAPAAPSPSSPVAASYARLAEVFPALRIAETAPGARLPHGVGWVGADELAAGGPALDAFLAWDEAQVLRDYGTRARPDVVASFGLHRYAWPACLLVTVPWFLERRVPRLPAREVAFQRAQSRLAVRIEEFACLPDDPAAVLPGARVVADEEALRAEVRASLAEHFEAVLDGFGPRLRRGRRALWGMATDEIVEGLWYIGGLLGEERRAMAQLDLLMPGTSKPYRPYAGAAGFRELAGSEGPDGRPHVTRSRATCCFFYTVRPEDTCLTCPRTCDAERVSRLATTD